jgi:tetratricopeptide (TPR) repeat protein
MALGRHSESLVESKRLLELDPLSPHMNAHLGLDCALARRLDEAAAQLEHTVTIAPGYVRAHVFLGSVYTEQQRFPAAIATLTKALSLRGDSTEGVVPPARAYILSGDREKGVEVIRQLEREADVLGRYVSPIELAALEVALGDRDRAFPHLEQAYAARSARLTNLEVNPVFRGLHDDGRFRTSSRESASKIAIQPSAIEPWADSMARVPPHAYGQITLKWNGVSTVMKENASTPSTITLGPDLIVVTNAGEGVPAYMASPTVAWRAQPETSRLNLTSYLWPSRRTETTPYPLTSVPSSSTIANSVPGTRNVCAADHGP